MVQSASVVANVAQSANLIVSVNLVGAQMKPLNTNQDDGLVDFIRDYSKTFNISIHSVVRRLILLGIYCEQHHEKLGMPTSLVDIVGPVCTLEEHKKFCNIDHVGECYVKEHEKG